MAAKKKNEEVSIIETKKHSENITDLEVQIKDRVIGTIHKDDEDRQYKVSYLDGKKGAAVSVEDAVQMILAQYNLHR